MLTPANDVEYNSSKISKTIHLLKVHTLFFYKKTIFLSEPQFS